MDVLKFLTCGSVDDGKSTLIGNLLYNAKLLYIDQINSLAADSKRQNGNNTIDYSLLLDGLTAEREQGITIDVAYRYFSTPKRSFIVADCPGHEQYTRNMAVGASFADLTIILINSESGITSQTKRHMFISSLMGIKNYVLAVNKMDLVDYSEDVFNNINFDFESILKSIDLNSFAAIPVSAAKGENIVDKSKLTPWYNGKSLLEYLEDIEINDDSSNYFIMPVQRVSRPDQTFRGYQGRIESGNINVNDDIIIYPSKEKASITKILIGDKETENAYTGQSVTLLLDRETDISRGSVLTTDSLNLSNMFQAKVLWMDDGNLLEGKSYILKCGTKSMPATISNIKSKLDLNTFEYISDIKKVEKNDIITCNINTIDRLVCKEFKENKALGRFILIDRITNSTAACGIIDYSLRRSENVYWHETEITRSIRADQKNQKPFTLWLTGLSGAGKSTIANHLEKRLVSMGKHTMLLDGDNLRHGLNSNLGFIEKDRIENIRRIAEVSKILNDAGIIVITALISPYESDRLHAKEIVGEDFILAYVNTPLEECERRDVKGLYQKARQGDIPNFTGITAPYETPNHPDVVLDTVSHNTDILVNKILALLGEEFLIV